RQLVHRVAFEVERDVRSAVRGDVAEDGTLSFLCRGMVDFEEFQIGKARRARVEARAEDDDLTAAALREARDDVVERAGADLHVDNEWKSRRDRGHDQTWPGAREVDSGAGDGTHEARGVRIVDEACAVLEDAAEPAAGGDI